MKNRVFAAAVVLVLVGGLFLGLTSVSQAETVLRVGATPRPHAEILEALVPVLAEEGITLRVVEFTDYVQPNLALQDGELDANYFQHVPYLDTFNSDRGTNLESLVGVHVEPLGVYSNRVGSVEELGQGARIAIPNDATNGGRALLLLQEAGLIELDASVGILPTVFDITANPKGIRFSELEAAQLPRSLQDVDAAVINGNYALEASLNPTEDSIFLEGSESPYVNILAVRAGDTDNPALNKLAEALQSELVRQFILSTYDGSVVPAF